MITGWAESLLIGIIYTLCAKQRPASCYWSRVTGQCPPGQVKQLPFAHKHLLNRALVVLLGFNWGGVTSNGEFGRWIG